MNYFSTFITNFHFIRPWWFLALFALCFALWLLKKHRFNQSPWNKFIPEHLSHILVEGSNTDNKTANKGFFSGQANLLKPFIIGLIAITALAGPTWQKLPQPVYQTERGSVLIMDMSYSMYATDIKPNRLTRARFKAVDLLNTINEGDIGLIAYAGDAFVISPLTQDIKNIELLLPSLSPEIMPELGANVFAALSLAHEMLTNAGHLHGDIYWFTDDVDNSEITDIYDWSAEYGHRLNILGIGSQDGAPITLPSGELLKDDQGAIVVPKLPISKLNGLASKGNGHYQTISHNDSDITALTSNEKGLSQTKEQQESQQSGDQWQEQGPWLLIVILPLLLGYFRRGSTLLALSSLTLPLISLLSFSLASTNVFATEQKQAKTNQVLPTEQETQQVSGLQQTWKNLWKTQDQQAQERYNQQDYQGAAQQFENSQWQGSAHYKSGNYQEALNAFKQGEHANTANSLYNQGNAYAQLQQYEQAIEAYENALEKNPDLQDAKDNLEKIKQMQKQEEQQQNQQSQENQSNDNNENQEQQQNAQDQQSQDQETESNNQQNQQSDNSEQENISDKQSQENQQQSDKQKQEQNQQESSQNESQQKSEQDKKETKEQEAQKAEQKGEQSENKTPAQIAAEQQAKETEQKHKQLLNKVTDDPYLLLRNKMQLEYQKRKQQGASQGAKKKW